MKSKTIVVDNKLLGVFRANKLKIQTRLQKCKNKNKRTLKRLDSIGKCNLCGIEFKLGDEIVKIEQKYGKYYHRHCFDSMIYDVDDDFDNNEKDFIEFGVWIEEEVKT